MDLNLFAKLLLFCTSVSVLATETIKKVKETIKPNIIALISSLTSTLIIAIGYGIIEEITVDGEYVFMSILLFISTWVSSMVGFDKVKQTVEQIKRD